MLFIAYSVPSLAKQTIDPPTDLKVQIITLKTNPPIDEVHLSWKAAPNTEPTGYNVYAMLSTDKGLTWSSPMLMTIVSDERNNIEQTVNLGQLYSGIYQFYVTAFTYDTSGGTVNLIESAESSIVTETVSGFDFNTRYFNLYDMTLDLESNETYTMLLESMLQTNLSCAIGYEITTNDNIVYSQSDNIIVIQAPKESGNYILEVHATPSCDSNLVSVAYIYVTVGDRDEDWGHIHIDDFNDSGFMISKDILFEYQIQGSSTLQECGVKYKIEPKPDYTDDKYFRYAESATLDSETGLLSWMPTDAGQYFLNVSVSLSCEANQLEESITFTMYFEVFDGEVPGYGRMNIILVDEETSQIIDYGLVQMWGSNSQVGLPTNYMQNVFAGTSSFEALSGEYFVYAEADGYFPEWYDNASDISNAQAITLMKDGEYNLTISLKKVTPPNMLRVSGRITASDTHNGIAAWIQFTPIEWLYGNGIDYKGYGEYLKELNVEADSSGYYSVNLPDIFTYIAHATPLKDANKYKDEYYGEVSNPYEATLISLKNGDIYNIDINLDLWQNESVTIGGNVTSYEDSSITIVSQIIVLSTDVHSEDNKGKYSYVSAVNTDSQGNFSLSNLPYGQYMLLSVPESDEYVPGYYKADDFATLKWKEATIISVDNINSQFYIIKHNSVEGNAGLAGLAGVVTANGGLAIGKDDGVASKSTLSGAMLYLIDQNANVVMHCISDSNGEFKFDNIANGTYTLLSDKAGYLNYETTIVIAFDQNNPVITTEVTLTEGITSIEDIAISNVSAYPLPANQNTILNFESGNGIATIELINATGLLLSSYTIPTVEGMNVYDLNTSKLSSGAYFINIKSGHTLKTIPMSVIK